MGQFTDMSNRAVRAHDPLFNLEHALAVDCLLELQFQPPGIRWVRDRDRKSLGWRPWRQHGAITRIAVFIYS